MPRKHRRTHRVFLNAPFDAGYRAVFDAIVFAVMDCGCTPQCALDLNDSGQVRIEKIYALIRNCEFGIHDISRVQLDPRSGLPRFNMPLELGIFLGARQFGNTRQRRKRCVVLDVSRFRYQRFCSDIAGQDIVAHGGHASRAIRAVRDWMSDQLSSTHYVIPGGDIMIRRYRAFRRALPEMCRLRGIQPARLRHREYTVFVGGWQRAIGPRRT
jgi:hypothetical protein